MTPGDALLIPASLHDAMVDHCVRDAPLECCGLLGGVPPLGHDQPLQTVIDASLGRFQTVWCAAGTPSSVFEAATADLIRATAGEVRELST